MRSIHSRFTHNSPRVIQVSVVFLRFCGATTWSARGMRNGRETFNRGGPPGPRAARYSRPTRLIFRADVSARLDSRIIRILRRSAGDVLFLFHFSPSHKFHRLVTLSRAPSLSLGLMLSIYGQLTKAFGPRSSLGHTVSVCPRRSSIQGSGVNFLRGAQKFLSAVTPDRSSLPYDLRPVAVYDANTVHGDLYQTIRCII